MPPSPATTITRSAAIRKLQRALMTTLFDAAGKGSAKACWALMRRARADRFESASSAAKSSPFQWVAFCRPKNPGKYWSAPRAAAGCRKASDFSRRINS